FSFLHPPLEGGSNRCKRFGEGDSALGKWLVTSRSLTPPEKFCTSLEFFDPPARGGWQRASLVSGIDHPIYRDHQEDAASSASRASSLLNMRTSVSGSCAPVTTHCELMTKLGTP